MDRETFDTEYRPRLERLGTGNLSDALDKLGIRGAVVGILPLFKTHIADVGSLIEGRFQSYAVSPDGQRFLINSIAEDMPAPSLTVVLHWPGGIRN